MEPIDEHFTTDALGGVELHLRAWGDPASPPMVLLHGGGANAHWWDHLAPRFADRFRVWALDFRGHGDSEHPEEHEAGAFQDDLEALLDWIGARDVVLVGHSMGAHVTLDHVSRHPETRAAVLIDPARGGRPRSKRRAHLALRLKRSYRSREEAIDRFRFLPPSDHCSEALRVAIATASVREEEDGRYGYKFDPAWFALPPRDRPDPAQIACPTLVVRGGESGILSREGAEKLVEEIPGARLCEIAGAGHHVLLDTPEALAAAIDDFVDALPRRSDPA